jgi:hypothetical protein
MRRLEARLVEDVRALRERDPRGALLLVVPSRLLGARLRARLARALDGVAGIHVVTLPELAERVALLPLALAGRQPLPAVADRLLVDRAIREAVPPAGGYFSGVLAARNFPAAVLRTLLDAKRAGLGPAELEAAFPSVKVRELAASPRARTSHHQHGYYDASDLLAEATRLVSADPGRLGAAAVLAFGFVELNPLEARLLDACGRGAPVLRYPAGADAVDLPAASAIEIVAAPGEEREVREIARVILGHVEAGGRLDEVGILLRQPATYLAAVRDVFGAAGIPYTLGTAPAVGETRAGRSLRLLAEVRRSDFARATVMEFLAFADLRARPGTSPAEWERLSRQAGIVGGAREWRERLDRLGRRLEPAAGADDDDEGAARGRRMGSGPPPRGAHRPARPLAASGSRPGGRAGGRVHAHLPPTRPDVAGGRAGAWRSRAAPGARPGGRRRAARGVLDAPRGGARRAVGRRPGAGARPRVRRRAGRRPRHRLPAHRVPGLVEAVPRRAAPGPGPLDAERRLTGLPLAERGGSSECASRWPSDPGRAGSS